MYGILYLTYTVQAEVGLYLDKTQYILSSYLCTLTIFLSEHISLDNKNNIFSRDSTQGSLNGTTHFGEDQP